MQAEGKYMQVGVEQKGGQVQQAWYKKEQKEVVPHCESHEGASQKVDYHMKKTDMEGDVNEEKHEVVPPIGTYLVLQWKEYGVVL